MREIVGRMELRDRLRHYAPLLLFGLAMSMIMHLNPFSNLLPLTDSSVFLYIGKAMRQYGLVPYRDVFDHKGPLLYFVNYLGMSIHPLHGIWFIELILMELDVVLAFKLARLHTKSALAAVCAAILAMLPLVICLCGGNIVEEYALPFILLALYLFSRRIDVLTSMSNRDFLLLGSSCGGVLLLRPNMIAVWAVMALILAIELVAARRFFRLLQAGALFLLGSAIVILPFLLYFWQHGALSDLIDDYLLFNMRYTGNGDLLDMWSAMLTFWNSNLLLPVSLLVCAVGAGTATKKSPTRLLYIAYILFLCTSLLAASVSGRTYTHYAAILVPCFVLPVAVLVEQIGRYGEAESKPAPSAKRLYRLAVELLGLYMIVMGALNIIYVNTAAPDSDMTEAAAYIQAHTAQDDRIIVMGTNSTLYLLADRRAASKYIYQAPVAGIAPSILDEFLADLKKNEPKMIIYDNASLNQEKLFDEQLMDELRPKLFALVENNPDYTLCPSVSDRYLIYERVEKDANG